MAAARRQRHGEAALAAAVRQTMLAVTGKASGNTAQRRGAAGVGVRQSDSDIHLCGAALHGRAAAGTAQQTADTEHLRYIGHIRAGQVYGAGHGEIAQHGVLRRAEKSQRRVAGQSADIEAGHGVSPSVQRAGKGCGCADAVPRLIAKIDIRRQHGTKPALRPAVHRLRQPCQLLRSTDAVGRGGSAAAVRPLHGDAVPVAGAVQQAADTGQRLVIGRLHGGGRLLQRLRHSPVGGQRGKIPVRRVPDGGSGVGQRRRDLLAVGSGILSQLTRQPR